MAPDRPQFRPDLEGVRGVAILLVVLFHAGISRLQGGFVGVDVFFVMSGFFITGLLVREQEDSGEIDLSRFYGRRALRLLPPLLLVVLATLAVVTVLYAPIDRAQIAGTARWVALYSGNIDFARGSVDYFSSGENPLLHTWSLAVEEQFYFVWPLLLLFVGSAYASGEGNGASKRLLVAMGIAGALSFIASIWLTNTAQPWAFFSMPTRIWEFALGGVLAAGLADQTERLGRFRGLLQVVGLGVIVAAALIYDKGTAYPGLAAVVPAFGAVAIIIGGQSQQGGVVSRALATPSLRWLGRMSYTWYLWHWPLVGLAAVLDWNVGVPGRLAWSAFALLLAWLTHRFIEQPSRDGPPSRWSPTTMTFAALGASAAVAMIAHVAMLAAERRAALPDQRIFAAARQDRMEHDCWATTVDEPKSPCEFGDRNSSTTVVLLGDSHAEHWLGGLDRVGRERGWRIVAMVKGGCPVADMPELTNARRRRYYEQCARYREAMVRRIIALKPAVAILASWDHYMPVDGSTSAWQVTPATWERGLHRTYERLSAARIPTIVIRDVPHTEFDVPGCLSRRAARLPFSPACVYERRGALSDVAIAAQTRAAQGTAVRFVDMNDQICPSARCGVVRNGAVVFTDDNHLTASFSRSVAPALGARLVAASDAAGRRLP
jgi:peptidoglycan/LPS O-acetylase OafA/YrhL